MKSRVLRLRAKEKKIGGKKRVKVDECFIKAVWEHLSAHGIVAGSLS